MRSQLTHVYVQKSTSTTFPRSPAGVVINLGAGLATVLVLVLVLLVTVGNQNNRMVFYVWEFDVIGLAQLRDCRAELP